MSQPPEPRYFIAQGENVQGPFTRTRVLELIQQGKVRADMMFSLEGGAWVQGHQVPDLFPAGAAGSAPLAGYADAQGHTPAPPTPAGATPRPSSGRRGGRRRPRLRPHRGGTVLTMGILGIVCAGCFVFGIIAWVMGSGDLGQMRSGSMDRSGEGTTQAGMICGIVGVVLGVLGWLANLVGGFGRGYDF